MATYSINRTIDVNTSAMRDLVASLAAPKGIVVKEKRRGRPIDYSQSLDALRTESKSRKA